MSETIGSVFFVSYWHDGINDMTLDHYRKLIFTNIIMKGRLRDYFGKKIVV